MIDQHLTSYDGYSNTGSGYGDGVYGASDGAGDGYGYGYSNVYDGSGESW
jgi:hypothetical protein